MYAVDILYHRHPKPRLDQRLRREGLKIFHACSEPLRAEEIAVRSGLPLGTVVVFIQNLLEQGVLSVYESGAPAPALTDAAPKPLPQTEACPSDGSGDL